MKKEKTKQSSKKEFSPKDIKQNSFAFSNIRIQATVLIILGFIFYSNTFKNEYALDDGIVIEKNEYVQKGIAGIAKILKTDAYDSFYRQMGSKQQLSGGRYRPLSPITFAIEEQFFGSKAKEKPPTDIAFIRHLVNVILYILSIVILLYFLQTFIFKETPLVGFITCLLFLIHPLHTEVVANVKSRDEILSFLFVILTFISVMRYRENKKIKQLIWGLVFYFLALLSKEYAVTLLILIPMLLYLVKGDIVKDSLRYSLPYFFVALVYLLIRYSIVGKGATTENPDVLNNPYMFATKPEKWATKIEILNHYIRLLFYPNPLSSDYSYSSIPFVNFKNGWVWFAIFSHIAMIVGTIVLFFRKNILAFAFAFYLLHLFMICNLLMDIGATMGERLIYHSSFGFAMIIAVMINWILNELNQPKIKIALLSILGIGITYWCGAIVIPRNAQWKNDTSLFIHDSNVVPFSVLVNGNAGQAYIKLSDLPENKTRQKELLDSALIHLDRALSIHTRYVNGYLNRGVAYYQLKQYDKARENWDMANTIYPNNPYLTKYYQALGGAYYFEGMQKQKTPQEAVTLLEKATQVAPNYTDYWYNLGGAYFTLKNYEAARQAWTRVLQMDPNNLNAKNGLAALPTK